MGTVADIKKGAVNAEVVIDLKEGLPVIATITNGVVENLGLKKAMEAYAIIKASFVIIDTDLHHAKLSARNVMKGTIARIIPGPVSAEVDLDVGAGNAITAVIHSRECKKSRPEAGKSGIRPLQGIQRHCRH